MIEGDVSQYDYLSVSPAFTTVIPSANCFTQRLETDILRQRQILEVRFHIFTLRSAHRLHL
jgi:hypothetical protein